MATGTASAFGSVPRYRIVHVDHGHDIRRLSVEQRRLVFPLPDRLQGSIHQFARPAHQLQIQNFSVQSEQCRYSNRPLDSFLFRLRRVARRHLPRQFGGLHVAPNAKRDRWPLAARRQMSRHCQ